MKKRTPVGIIVLLLLAGPAWATPSIILEGVPGSGKYELLPDLAGQQFPIFVHGGDQIQGVEFFLQVADGGPEVPGGLIDGPTITNIDIFTGTIFTGNNTGEAGAGSLLPQFWQSGTTTQSGTVAADGKLATVTIDTTGFLATDARTSWELRMSGTRMGDSWFPGVTTLITNGLITIADEAPAVPEPSTMVLLSLGGLGLICLICRRNRC